jgi:hypothetical protein
MLNKKEQSERASYNVRQPSLALLGARAGEGKTAAVDHLFFGERQTWGEKEKKRKRIMISKGEKGRAAIRYTTIGTRSVARCYCSRRPPPQTIPMPQRMNE